MKHIAVLCSIALCHAHETTSAAHDHADPAQHNSSHILVTQTLSTLSPTNYPNLTNLDTNNKVLASTPDSSSSPDTVLVLSLTLGSFAIISVAFIILFKLFLTWRDQSSISAKQPRSNSFIQSVLSVSRPSRSREPTISGDNISLHDRAAVLRKESVLTEIWNDAETTHELESGYQEHITSKTHDTDAITEAAMSGTARRRVGSTGYIEAIFAQYNEPEPEMNQMIGEEEQFEAEEKHEMVVTGQVILDVRDELYRSPTKKYRIAVSSIDDLEPFDINESFEEMAGSVTPPHREHSHEDCSAEEHSLETHQQSEDGHANGHGNGCEETAQRESVGGHERAAASVSLSLSRSRSRSASVESVHGFEAEESVSVEEEESSAELVEPRKGKGYVD